ncbi:WD repeat-containing protein 90 [Eulemur rufifrons]|uniref:WD repeat-containing protein 90 n=1 Tax=Eulemur rufifrons TaxID=859984 RepID=UPI00374442DC
MALGSQGSRGRRPERAAALAGPRGQSPGLGPAPSALAAAGVAGGDTGWPALGAGSSPPVPFPAAWQQPFLNVFRHFKVDEWKRSTKEGDVAVVTDKTLRGRVYRIRGSVPAGSYIQLPRTSTQSLGLTGRFLYLLFRPLPSKHFVIHLDVATEDSQVVRVSFSSLFKEFKSTATWLQFPFVFEARTSGGDLAGAAPPGARWTFLQLDLQDILLLYLNRSYSHLKSVRLCASLLVRNLYTSDLCFDPAVTVPGAQRAKLPVTPVPREMAFPVPKGESWHDRYIHVRFPHGSTEGPPELVPKSRSPPEAVLLGPVPRLLPCLVAVSKPMQDCVSPTVQTPSPTASCQAPVAPRPLPEVSLSCECSEISSLGGPSVRSREPSAQRESADVDVAADGVHVFAHESAVVPVALGDTGSREHFLPDPILRLKGVIGFGGHSTKWALWTKDGAAVVYPCHAAIVVLRVHTGEQRLLLGHTDKVSALALDGGGVLLASAQARPSCMLRLWDFQTGACLSLFRSPMQAVSSLSFSDSGALLCGVGKDRHGRTVVVAWDTGPVGLGGEVAVLAKVRTDFDIQAFRVASFDGTRMASCGQGSVRLWRLRGAVLRSCPVDLGEHRALQFADLAFEPAQDGCRESSARALYVCSRGGHVLEIDPQRRAVQSARCLLPTRTPSDPHPQTQTLGSGPGIAISSLSVSPTLCAVGSEDGYLRLWPRDFSAVLLEAEHEGPVSWVCVSPDGLRVLSATATGHLGVLDVPSREYSVLARAHTAPVLALSTERSRGQLATVSQDRTVRIWDLATLQQLYDFTSSEEAPSAVAFHPTRPAFFCGFSSGAVRAFSLEAAEVLVEHTCPRGAITGLAVTPDGNLLFSSCSQGSLAQYSCAGPRCRVLRVAANVVCPDAHPSPNTLAVSGDSRLLAFVGLSKCTVTVVDPASLDELLRVDIGTPGLDSAVAVCFGPTALGHLLVSTSSGRVVVLDATSGRTVRELCGAHPAACPSLALSEDARFLLAAAGRAVTVWDYSAQPSPGSQVYIGHSEPVRAVAFTPDQQQVLSVGDAIFLWDIVATSESDQSLSRAPPACEAGPGPGQLEDAASGAGGLPRPQVPVPSQAPPPRPDVRAGPLEGDDGEGRGSWGPGRSRGQTAAPACVQLGGVGVVLPLLGAQAGQGGGSFSPPTAPQTRSPRRTRKDPVRKATAPRGFARPQAHPSWRRRPAALETGPGGLQVAPGSWPCPPLPAASPAPGAPGRGVPSPAPTGAPASTSQRATRHPPRFPGVSGLRSVSKTDSALGLRDWSPLALHPHSCHPTSILLTPPPPLTWQVPFLGAPGLVPLPGCSPPPRLPRPHSPLPSPAGPGVAQTSSHLQAPGPRPGDPSARSASSQSLCFPPASGARLRLKAVLGYSGRGRANMVWRPDTGFFAYTCGRLVVVEDLHSGAQQHWLGHPEDISTLALSHDAQVLASASGCSLAAAHCQIRVWDVSGGLCQHLLSHHDTAVQALAFSPDDRLLVTLGDYSDRTLAVWSTATYDLVCSTRLLEPVRGVAFSPWDADQLTCLGQRAVTFWLLQRRGADISLQVHREPVPEAVGAGELTSLCYGPLPLLYCGSSSGQVCVWDTRAGRCFLAWEADDSEIGVLLCAGPRLVSGSGARRLRLWAVGTVPELRRRSARSSSVFMEHELSLDGGVVSASFDDSMDMGVVGTAAGTLWYISWAEGTSTRLVSGHRSRVNEVVFSPSESHCATCGEDGSVRVWSLASLELVIQFQVLNQSCLCLAWSPPSCGRPEQQRLAAGYGDGTLRLFSISRTAMELKMRPHPSALTAVAFSTDGQTVLSGDKDGLVAVSRPCTGMTFRVLSDHRGAPISTIQVTSKEYGDLGVQGTDLWLAASGDQRVSVWASDWLWNRCELLDWLSFPTTAVLETRGHPLRALAAFCPWDRVLLVHAGLGVHKEVIVYSLRQKQVVERISLPFFAISLSLSPGAHLMAIGFAECVLRLLDCARGTAQDFAGHGGAVHLCRFTPSARLLFTVAHSEILVWEVSSHCAVDHSAGCSRPHRRLGRGLTEKPDC